MATHFKHRASWAVAYNGQLDGKPKGKRAYIYGIATEKLARAAAAEKTKLEQLFRAGLYKPEPGSHAIDRAAAEDVAKHADDFERAIVSRGRKPKHAHTTAQHVRRILALGNVTSLADLENERVQSAAAKLLTEDKLAPRTVNAAIKAMRQFSRWLKRAKRIRHHVLDELETYNEERDTRRKRRALSEEELHWLITTTESARDFTSRRCGIGPKDRAMLYLTGLGTGFRQAALLTLTPASFHVAKGAARPHVRLGAAANKKGKDRVQPIRADLADRLRTWLEGKPANRPVWQPSPHADLSLRYRRDLENARNAYVAAAEGDAERRRREESHFCQYVYNDGVRNVYADFHGLRHTGITLVVRHAGLKAGQVWADHSTSTLTEKYAHTDLSDEERSLSALPPTPPTPTAAARSKPESGSAVSAGYSARDGKGRKTAEESGKRSGEKSGGGQ